MTEPLRNVEAAKNISTYKDTTNEKRISFPVLESVEYKILKTSLLSDKKITPFLKRLETYTDIRLANGDSISGKMLRTIVEDHLRISPEVNTADKYPLEELNIDGFPEFSIHLIKLVRDAENSNSIYPDNNNASTSTTPSKYDLPTSAPEDEENFPEVSDEMLRELRDYSFEERPHGQAEGLTDSHYKKYIADRERMSIDKKVSKDTFNAKGNDTLDEFNIEGNFVGGEKKDTGTLVETKSAEDLLHTEWIKNNKSALVETKKTKGFVDDMHTEHMAKVASGEYKPIVRTDVVDDDFPARGFLYQEPTKPKIDINQVPFEDTLYTDYTSREAFQKAREQEFLNKLPGKKNKETKKMGIKNGFKSLFNRLINKKDKKEGKKSEEIEDIVESRFPDHDVFLDSLYNDDPSYHAKKMKDAIEKHEEVKRKIEAVEKNTKSLRERTLEKLGLKGETFLSLCDKGSEFFGKNVSLKTKLFASAGLLTAGALSASAGPVVLTTIGLTTLAMRGISSAGTYLAVRGILEKNYEAREQAGKKVSSLEKGLYGAGAVVIAAGAGQAIGYLFEQLAIAAEEGITSAKDLLEMTKTVAPASIPTEVIQEALPVDPVVPESTHIVSPEIITPPLEVVHTVIRNENLWSVVRKSLESIDYEGFSHLSRGVQEAKISLLVDKIAEDPKSFGVMSGKIDLIRPGETINLTKLFTK